MNSAFIDDLESRLAAAGRLLDRLVDLRENTCWDARLAAAEQEAARDVADIEFMLSRARATA